MARWDVQQTRQKISVLYKNLHNGRIINCGDNRPDTPVSIILDWVAEHSDPGDAVFLNGRVVWTKMQVARA